MLLGNDGAYGTGISAPFSDPAVDEELTIALRAGNRRTDETDDPHAGLVQRRDCLFDRLRMDLGVADDPTAANQPLACLELWFDQQDPIGLPGAEGTDLRSNQRQRDEGEIGHHEIERSAKRSGIGVTDIRSFHNSNPGIGANPMMKLAISNIERDHLCGSALEKAVGETSGRCTDVDRDPALDWHIKRFDRAIELRSGSAHELRGRAVDREWILWGDQRRRLRCRVPAHAHAPGVDHPARLGA